MDKNPISLALTFCCAFACALAACTPSGHHGSVLRTGAAAVLQAASSAEAAAEPGPPVSYVGDEYAGAQQALQRRPPEPQPPSF